MTGRNRRGSRGAGTKARIGVAAALLIGGGAAGVAVVAANNHGTAGTTANDAGFIMNIHHNIGQEAALSAALTTWGRSHQSAMNTLAQMVPMRNFTQQWGGWHHRTQFAAQRGVVVLATKNFLVVKSANGGLHLWWLTGTTAFQNVTANPTGMTAMTGNNTAAMKAVTQSNTVTAQTVMAGSTNAVAQAAAPTRTTTLTITTGTLTITITITPTTAVVGSASATPTGTPTGTVTPTMSPSATMSVAPTATVSATPTVTPSPTTTATQPVTTATHGVAAGDLVMITGVRVHGRLIAKIVLFSAPATTMATPTATPSVSVSATTTTTAQPTVTGTSATFSGHGS